MYPMIGMPGGWELVLIVLVIVLLFGAKKLPELARGSGQALRIFKAETKGLDGDEQADGTSDRTTDPRATPEQREIEARRTESQRLGEERGDGTVA